MRHILVPTDFSKNAFNALTYGIKLFQKNRCTFYIIHINPLPSYSGAASTVKRSSKLLEEKLLRDSRKNLQQLISKVEKLGLNTRHTFVPIATYDFFVATIRREAEEKNIDLILMGTKGASGLKKTTVGSNTGDVITKVKHSLLAVPENAEYRKPREIAFATDYHTGYDVRVLDTLMEMATIHKSIVRILHISKKGEKLNNEQETNKQFLHDYFKDVDHSFHSLTGTELETAVQCFTESRDIDMIAMVAKNLNFFQRILFRPAVEKISYHTAVPFLVLHE